MTEVILGPPEIGAIAEAVETLEPALDAARYRVLSNGGVEFAEAEPAEAVKALRRIVEEALPPEVCEQVGTRSGLGWNLFFAHVVTWWLPQRGRVGFLRALLDRAALHGVKLELHWNAGRSVPALPVDLGFAPLIAGGVAGAIGGFLVAHWYPYDTVLPLLTVAGGVAAGRIWQRTARPKQCGDRLCRTRLPGRAPICPSCGGQVLRDAA